METGKKHGMCLLIIISNTISSSTSNTNSITLIRHSVNGIQEHECVSKDVGDIGCCRVIREGGSVANCISDPEMRTGHPFNKVIYWR